MPASEETPFAHDNSMHPLFCIHCGAMRFALPDSGADTCWRCRTELTRSQHPREGNQTKDDAHD